MRFLRSLPRVTTQATLVAVLMLGIGASGALAAPAQTGRYDFGDSWCFEESGGTRYCFETDGFLRYTITPAGDEIGVIKFREHVVISEAGVVVGEYTTISMDQSRFVDGALVVDQTVEHTSARFGDETCVFTTVFRMANYDIVVNHDPAPTCH